MTTGCGGKHNDLRPVLPPAKATLLSPAQNEACTTGRVISDTQSSITFTWEASDNTDSYELDIKNLLTRAVTTQTTTNVQLVVTLTRDTPYSWYIVSKSSQARAKAQSDTWKFYNAGLGTVSYTPFPAEITAPAFGQNVTASSGTITLTWLGNSVEGDITGYDVYFGTISTPPLLKGGVTDMFLDNVRVTSGSTYYWKVITKSSTGSTSDSGLSQFVVN